MKRGSNLDGGGLAGWPVSAPSYHRQRSRNRSQLCSRGRGDRQAGWMVWFHIFWVDERMAVCILFARKQARFGYCLPAMRGVRNVPSPPDFPHMLSLQALGEALSTAALGVIAAVCATSAALRLSERRPAKNKPRLGVMNGTAAQMETPRLRYVGRQFAVTEDVRGGTLIRCVVCIRHRGCLILFLYTTVADRIIEQSTTTGNRPQLRACKRRASIYLVQLRREQPRPVRRCRRRHLRWRRNRRRCAENSPDRLCRGGRQSICPSRPSTSPPTPTPTSPAPAQPHAPGRGDRRQRLARRGLFILCLKVKYWGVALRAVARVLWWVVHGCVGARFVGSGAGMRQRLWRGGCGYAGIGVRAVVA